MFLKLLLLLLLLIVLSSENFGFPPPYEFMAEISPACKFGTESIRRYYKPLNLGKQKFTLHHATKENLLKLLEGINPTKATGLDTLA